MEFACLTTLREQYVKQYRQTLVSLKGICQSWGLNISKGISGKARLSEMIEKYEKFPEELRRELQNMVKHAQEVQKALTEINKTLKQVSKGDELCKMVQRSQELVWYVLVGSKRPSAIFPDSSIQRTFLFTLDWFREASPRGTMKRKDG